MSMIITYIVQIEIKMKKILKENLKLLDKMDEGLIMISEKDKKFQFASKPAIALLKKMP